ncbi:UNVERIFIED_CONTAM: hypothetical protein FKN15_067288 [Acipenser sinensis]
MDPNVVAALLEAQDRRRDGEERRREERDAQRDAERTAHMATMMQQLTAMCSATFLSYAEVETKREKRRPWNLDLSLPTGEPSSACIVEDTDQLEEAVNVR